MAGNGYYPPEYGSEAGERCGRGACSGRMRLYEDETPEESCTCFADDEQECICEIAYTVCCEVCGDGPYA